MKQQAFYLRSLRISRTNYIQYFVAQMTSKVQRHAGISNMRADFPKQKEKNHLNCFYFMIIIVLI